MLAVVAPGQGAQAPGFLSPWVLASSFSDRLNWLSAVSCLDLEHYGVHADAETIRDTAVAQPLLVASGLLAALELFPHPADAYPLIGVAAGHSVGEITAAAGVGVFSAESAMVFVAERGRAMAAASAARDPAVGASAASPRYSVTSVSTSSVPERARSQCTAWMAASSWNRPSGAPSAEARRSRARPSTMSSASHIAGS